MTGAEYIGRKLVEHGVKDAFGIPGGVVLDLMYALRDSGIKLHLNYHEQASGFAALGYAQSTGGIGVAYATRGPGISNMFTAIAEAYYESIPVLFLTGHSCSKENGILRAVEDQEMNIVKNVLSITKYSSRVETRDELVEKLEKAIKYAVDGRKGPVLLDINSRLMSEQVLLSEFEGFEERGKSYSESKSDFENKLKLFLMNCKRPIVLIGDGIKQSNLIEDYKVLLDNTTIPVLSSRGSQDIMSGSHNYYGYIGSHGIRYANCIFEKADFVLSIGNRLAFPVESISYQKALENKKILRIDIDKAELQREIPNTESCLCNLTEALDVVTVCLKSKECVEWLKICDNIKEVLKDYDYNTTISKIEKLLKQISKDSIIVADVGNNEFWLSRAYEKLNCTNKILYSKSFGTLGCSIAKSIGVHYATGKSVICFIGDQGLQLNIQELQTLSSNRIPVCVVVINNGISAMIRDRQEGKKNELLHTTPQSGYYPVNIKKIADAYNIEYFNGLDSFYERNLSNCEPGIIEIFSNSDEHISPSLPKGARLCNMVPKASYEIVDFLEKL